jgi:ABC-type enterochelin transport system permease subunit
MAGESPVDTLARERHPTHDVGRELLRVISAFCGFMIGAFAGVLSLYVRYLQSHHEWQARRYWDVSGISAEILDLVGAMLMAGILCARLSQVLVSIVARRLGGKVPATRLSRWDIWLIGLPLVVWGYLIYVANVGDIPFWPLVLAYVIGGYLAFALMRAKPEKRASQDPSRKGA